MADPPFRELCVKYQLGPTTDTAPLGGTRNRNYRLTCGSRSWFARQRYAHYAIPDWLAFDQAAAKHWAQRSAAIFLPKTTTSNDNHAVIDGECWQVFPFVNGVEFTTSAQSVCALGLALGKLHAAGADFEPRFEKLSPRGETDPAALLADADRIAQESPDCADALAPYSAAIHQACAALPDSAYAALPHTLVHGDIQPANILMRGDTIIAFVDLDWCAWQPRIYDLACAILFCCAHHDEPFNGADIWSLTQPPRIDTSLADCFLTNYETNYSPLTDAERTALLHQITLTWCACRIGGAGKVSPHRRATFLRRPPMNPTDATIF